MESQPHNPEFRINPEIFTNVIRSSCAYVICTKILCAGSYTANLKHMLELLVRDSTGSLCCVLEQEYINY